MSTSPTPEPRRFYNSRWTVGGRIDRLDGLAWRMWVKFHGRYRCFVPLNAQRWNMKHDR